MQKKKPIFSGFGKPGEKVEEKRAFYVLSGSGTDLGCVLEVQEVIKRPSLLQLQIRGSIKKGQPWSRLRVEIYDRGNLQNAAAAFEDDFLMNDLSAEDFKSLSFPILGIVKRPYKVQVMVVGPSESYLEIRRVRLI